VASRLFDPARLPVEHAKARNMLGIALKEQGDAEPATREFRAAAELFSQHDQPTERAAALYNLGLVTGEPAWFRQARDLFSRAGAGAQAAAAARELGARLLDRGELDEAVDVLTDAVDLARAGGDVAGLGHAANLLGLAHLADDDAARAATAFQAAAGAHPRTVRPDAYAMAKANLALAWQRAGAQAHARLAARQALTAGGDRPVLEQAAAVLRELGDPPGDVVVVLRSETPERWAGIMREEVARWAELAEDARARELDAWARALGRRPPDAPPLAEAWLGALLELPPAAMDAIAGSALAAAERLDGDQRAAFAETVRTALIRFPPPQLLRLEQHFAAL
jgi:tetratricopeptide (TPR) repeat protein